MLLLVLVLILEWKSALHDYSLFIWLRKSKKRAHLFALQFKYGAVFLRLGLLSTLIRHKNEAVFEPEEFELTGFAFSRGRKTFWYGAFRWLPSNFLSRVKIVALESCCKFLMICFSWWLTIYPWPILEIISSKPVASRTTWPPLIHLKDFKDTKFSLW